LLEKPMARLTELLAFVAAASLNAVKAKHDQSRNRLEHAEHIATAIGLGMRRFWTPDAVFLSRLTKIGIAEVLGEAGCTPEAVRMVEKAPKAEAVAEAEKLLLGTSWLPSVLLTRNSPAAETASAAE
jgi:ParB family chromosome partitioning protein